MNHGVSRELEVFSAALALPPAEREGYLDAVCGDDRALRQRVERLLRAEEQVGDFLEEPAQQALGDLANPAVVSEKPGDRIGRYKLLEQIGEGGCGVVYMAEQEEPVRRRVALKIIKPGMDTRSVVARFEAERQALAMMDHPSIAKIFDAGATASGRPYFVMELVRGIKITTFCDQKELSTDARLKLFVQVCQAVQHAHQKGIIHRDLKPSNILVTTTAGGDALPVVIDFGIAKASTNQRLTDKTLFTAFEMLIGTPAYMSPEQAEVTSVDVDTRTDIYSLGVLLYELLTGSPPFDTGDLLKSGLDEVRRVIREQEPPRPSTRLSKMTAPDIAAVAQHRRAEVPTLVRSIKGDLDWIVMKALEKDRGRRYETANGLGVDVQRYLADEAISARPPSAYYRFQKTLRRHRVLFGSLSVIGVLLVVALVIISYSLARERTARLKSEADNAKSQQITRFLEEMLAGVGPAVALGRDTTLLRDVLDRAAGRVGDELANQPAVQADLRNKIGAVYQQLGRYEEAESMHRAALAGYQALLGEKNEEVAQTLTALALVRLSRGELADAEKIYRQVLALRMELFGPDDLRVADAMLNLSTALARQGRLEEYTRWWHDGMELRKKLLGDKATLADRLQGLQMAVNRYTERDQLNDWESSLRELLQLQRDSLGRQHPEVAKSLGSLTNNLRRQGRYEESERLSREALAIQQQLVGAEHPDYAGTLCGLGMVLQESGQLTAAETALRQAFEIRHRKVGDENPVSSDMLRALSVTLRAEGKLDEAEELGRQALASGRRALGNYHFFTAKLVVNLAEVLMDQGKYEEAERLLAESLPAGKPLTPEQSPLLKAQARFWARRNELAKAVTVARQALSYRENDSECCQLLGVLLAETGDIEGYEKVCRDSLVQLKDATEPIIAERIARTCLLLPMAGVDRRQVRTLVETARTKGEKRKELAEFKCDQALLDYRDGHFDEALSWAREALRSKPDAYVTVQSQAISALALERRGEHGQAQQALALAHETVRRELPSRGEHDLRQDWLPWLLTRRLLAEADRLVTEKSSTPSSGKAGGK